MSAPAAAVLNGDGRRGSEGAGDDTSVGRGVVAQVQVDVEVEVEAAKFESTFSRFSVKR